MKWFKLTKNNEYSLVAFRSQSGEGFLGLAFPENNKHIIENDFMPILQKDGFALVDGVPVKTGFTFSAKVLKELFPDMEIVDYSSSKDVTIKEPHHKWMLPIVHKSLDLGFNANGDIVRQGFGNVRFSQDVDGNKSLNTDISDLLIWDGSEDGLAKCAAAFVVRLAKKASPATASDLRKFAELICYGKDNAEVDVDQLMRPLQEAVESALYRYQREHSSLNKDGLERAILLYNRQPIFENRTTTSIKLQQYSTPIHLSLIVQHILGDMSGHTVVEPTIGNGSLVSLLPSSVKKVIGCDLDQSRLSNTRRLFSWVADGQSHFEVKDATSADFTSMNNGEKVDAIIGNPPFGGLDKPLKMDGVKVGRIDHQIVLNALKSRKEQGVGVFIIGADSYVDSEAGKITGNSKWFFNYLADNYELDVVEVPGKAVYTRQGAAYPIRVVVVGDRFNTPKEDVSLDTIRVVDNIDELWSWSVSMRDKHGLIDEAAVAPFYDDMDPMRWAGSVVMFSGAQTGVILHTLAEGVGVVPQLSQEQIEKARRICEQQHTSIEVSSDRTSFAVSGARDWFLLGELMTEVGSFSLLGNSDQRTFTSKSLMLTWGDVNSVISMVDNKVVVPQDGFSEEAEILPQQEEGGLTTEIAGVHFSAQKINGLWTIFNGPVMLASSQLLGAPNTLAGVWSKLTEMHAQYGDDAFKRLCSSPLAMVRDGMQAVVRDDVDLDVPDGWIICNSTRPLIGDRIIENGPYTSGRFYALIDPANPIAASYLKSNSDLDAKILLFIPKDEQVNMALLDNEYADAYRKEYSGDDLYSAVNPKMILSGLSYRDVVALREKASATKTMETPMQGEASNHSADKDIAANIIALLGNGFARVTGAKNFCVINSGVQFSLPSRSGYVRDGINRIKIILNGKDLFDVIGLKVTSRSGNVNAKVKAEYEDVYADSLIGVLEEMTGLACIMPVIHGVNVLEKVQKNINPPPLPSKVETKQHFIEQFKAVDAELLNLIEQAPVLSVDQLTEGFFALTDKRDKLTADYRIASNDDPREDAHQKSAMLIQDLNSIISYKKADIENEQAKEAANEEYKASLLANLHRFTEESIDKDKRLTKAELEVSGCGKWTFAQVDGQKIRMAERVFLLSDRYPSEVENLLEHGKLGLDNQHINDSTRIDELMCQMNGERLTIEGKTGSGQDSLLVMTSGSETMLVDEALVRMVLRVHPDAVFVSKMNAVEVEDLNGDPLGYIMPRSNPSLLREIDFYQQLRDAVKKLPVLAPNKEEDRKTAPVEANSYQTAYQAGSKLSPATSMIPVNMSGPVQTALGRVQADYGDIDAFVAGRLQWSTDELGQYLSPEQIDAVALALHAADREQGFLEGDQTGLGKGRVMAAMARYAALNNKPTIFLTETPTLFSDLWRDITDIDSANLFKPFIMNAGVPVFDVISGKKLFQPTSVSERQSALDSGVIPEDVNLVLATYSQFNREASKSLKARWLATAAKGAVLLMDEAHNAAGESNTGDNLKKAVEVAEMVVYSSATSMKDAKNVMIYSKLFPATVDLGSLPETLATGGEVLQEVLSAMLADDGVFIRREHDLSNLTITSSVDVTHEARNRDLSDRLASILELMNYIAGDINELVSKRNKEITTLLEKMPASERKGNRMGASSVNFGSRLFNLYRQFLMAIKVDEVVEIARNAISQGMKPVIILENTMEALLKETIFDLSIDETALDAEDDITNTEVGLLTFRDVLLRTLDRISSYQETDRYGNITRHQLESEESLEILNKIRQEINDFPDLAVSPIDEVVGRLEKDGIFCDELSGRKLKIKEVDGRYFAMPIIERPKATIVNDFNAGRSDAIILSRAGSTGISLHSSEKFPDQRKRCMIELQSAADVNKRVQFFGRVNRKGQVNDPLIVTVSSGLPGESRPIAMQNAKLRKLSANTTSNQDNAALDDDVPDFLNALGNRIAQKYLENNPSIADRLDIDADSEDPDGTYFINKLTSRIMMLKVAEQEMIYDELTSDFKKELARLDAIGENPLKSRLLDIKAAEVSVDIETQGNPYSGSKFDENIYIKELEYTEKLNPVRSDKVTALVKEGEELIRHSVLNKSMMAPAEFLQGLVSFIAARQMEMIKAAMPKRKYKSVDDALADPEPNPCQKMRDRLKFIIGTLMDLRPGSAIKFSAPDGEMTQGIVTALRLPEKMESLDSTGKYSLSIMTPGATTAVHQTFYMLMSDPHFAVLPRFTVDSVMQAIDAAPRGERLRKLTILDGNLFGAAERVASASLGRSVIYTDETGQRKRAIMLASGVTKERLAMLPIRVTSCQLAVSLLKEGIDLSASQSVTLDNRKSALMLCESGGQLVIMVSGSVGKGGHIFKDDDLIAITGEFSGNRSMMQAKVPLSYAKPIVERLSAKGIALYALPEHKDKIDELKLNIYANESCNDTTNRLKI